MQIRSDGMCKLEWNLKFLPKALWIYLRGISFHSFSLYSLCIQEHRNAENLCFMSTFFNPPSVKLLRSVLCFIFARSFPNRKASCICFSSSRKEFGTNVSNAKHTILEIASDLKICYLFFQWQMSHVPKFYNIRNVFYRVTEIFIVLRLSVIWDMHP